MLLTSVGGRRYRSDMKTAKRKRRIDPSRMTAKDAVETIERLVAAGKNRMVLLSRLGVSEEAFRLWKSNPTRRILVGTSDAIRAQANGVTR